MKKVFRSAAVFSLILLFATPNNSHALMFGLGVSIAAREAGREARKTVASARDAAAFLIDKTEAAIAGQIGNIDAAVKDRIGQINQNTKERLEQLDTIVEERITQAANETEAVAINTIKEMSSEIRRIEEKIVADIGTLIWQVECGATRLVIQTGNIALGDISEVFGLFKLRVEPPIKTKREFYKRFCLFFCSDAVSFDVTDNFRQVYKNVKKHFEDDLRYNLEDDHKPFAIVGSYLYLRDLAQRGTCITGGATPLLSREAYVYGEKANRWLKYLDIELE